MRRADDSVDDAADESTARAELQRFAEDTRDLLWGSGEVVRDCDRLWVAMQHVVQEYGLPHAPFDDMLRGQSDDLSGRAIETEADLISYCKLVASSVGILCIEIWGYEGEEAPQLAVDRGIALQLTNVLRDIGGDAAEGRCYLPSNQLRSRGLDVRSLVSWDPPAQCEQLIAYWVDQASSYYRSSAPLDALVSSDCRSTLRAMTGIYHAILGRIASKPRRCCGVQGVRLSKLAKLRIAFQACRSKP